MAENSSAQDAGEDQGERIDVVLCVVDTDGRTDGSAAERTEP